MMGPGLRGIGVCPVCGEMTARVVMVEDPETGAHEEDLPCAECESDAAPAYDGGRARTRLGGRCDVCGCAISPEADICRACLIAEGLVGKVPF